MARLGPGGPDRPQEDRTRAKWWPAGARFRLPDERLRRVRAEMNMVGNFQSVIDELSEQGSSIIHTPTLTRDLFEYIPDAVSF